MTTALVNRTDAVVSPARAAQGTNTARAHWPEDWEPEKTQTFLESIAPFITAAGFAQLRG